MINRSCEAVCEADGAIGVYCASVVATLGWIETNRVSMHWKRRAEYCDEEAGKSQPSYRKDAL